MVARPTGVQRQRKGRIDSLGRSLCGDRLHLRATIGGLEAAIGEQARGAPGFGDRPLHRCQRIVGIGRNRRQRPQIQHPVGVLEGRELGPLYEHLGGRTPAKGGPEAHATRHIRHHPPIGPRLAGWREQTSLTGDAALGIGDRPVLLAPGQSGQFHMRKGHGVGVGHAIRHHHERASGQRRLDPPGIRQADRRVGGHDPQRLDPALRHRIEHLDGLQTGPLGKARTSPEALNPIPRHRVEVHMSRQGVGHAAGFAPPHGIGLAGDREGAGPRLADPPGGQVRVDDGRSLGHALSRLVGAHREQADGLRRRGE